MHILVAPNAFKNSLSAPLAAEAIREGLLESGLTGSIQCFPIGDGGDGTGALIVKKRGGAYIDLEANDPLGRMIRTSIGWIDQGQTAVIEMAGISGLKILKKQELEPLRATSFGCGELIKAALDRGVRKIILAIGGSATTDGGSGALHAMGVNFLDHGGNELIGLPEGLIHLNTIDISDLDHRILGVEFVILCDVENFLLGDRGAAAVFGPQKGAKSEDIIQLERSLQRFRDVSLLLTGKDMNQIRFGGAAGGISAGCQIFLNARLVQGIEYFLDITEFDEALEKADFIITGEGRIDQQTLDGKGPFGVARRAKKKNKPVAGLAGQVPQIRNSELEKYFDVLMAVNQPDEDLETSMLHTALNLYKTAFRLGKMISEGTLNLKL